MKKINLVISPKFNSKIKSLLISDGTSKIILARQFISMTKIELQSYHSRFILHLSSINQNSSITSFKVNNSYYLYRPFSSNENEKMFFVLITDINYNPFEAEEILKTIFVFVTSLITSQNSNEDAKSIIKRNAFDIILAIDDVVNPILGSERVSQSKLKQNLKMESMEAKYILAKQSEKIEKAHQELVKGMEEIERLKSKNQYISNAVSNEDVDREKQELLESQQIINEIVEEKERINRMINIHSGLSLNRHILGRMASATSEDRERMTNFVNVCENIVQTMMLREIERMDDDDDDDQDEIGTTVQFVVPVQIFYSGDDN